MATTTAPGPVPRSPRDDDNDRTATEGEIEALRRTVSQPPQRRQSLAPPKKGTGARAYEELLGTRAELLDEDTGEPARTGLEFVSAAAHLPYPGQALDDGEALLPAGTPPAEDAHAVAARRRAEALALEADLAPRSPEMQPPRLKSCLSSSKKRRPSASPQNVTFAAGATTMEFERSDPPSALKSRRPQTIDVERRSSAPSRATSPPPPSAERRHTIENSAALSAVDHRPRGHARAATAHKSPRRASGRFDHDDASDTSSADSEECQAPRRSWAQAMELTGDMRRPELSPVVEESSPDSDRSTPQPTIPLEDHLGDLLALPPAQQRARPSETVQLEADLGAMLEAVRPSPKEDADVTMEDAALDTTQLLASLGLDDASLSKDAPEDVAADDETGRQLAAALAAAELTGDDDDGALVAATLAARSEAQALREAAAKIREAADECRRRSANILRTSANDVELAARVAPEVASSVVEAAKTFGRTVVLAASADADQRITRAFDLARVDVEQREKECMDAITALSEQEKAGDNIDAQTERLRQDAEHTIQQRRRSNQSEETWDATIAAKLAAGLEPWTPRSDGILDFPHACMVLGSRSKLLTID